MLVEIAHFYDPEEAYCARGYLGAQGVHTVIQNEHHLNVAPLLRVALGGYRLLAASEDANDAKRLLADVAKAESEIRPQEEPAPPQSSANAISRRARTAFWFPVAFSFGVPFIPPRRSGWIRTIEMAALISLYALLISWWAGWLHSFELR